MHIIIIIVIIIIINPNAHWGVVVTFLGQMQQQAWKIPVKSWLQCKAYAVKFRNDMDIITILTDSI